MAPRSNGGSAPTVGGSAAIQQSGSSRPSESARPATAHLVALSVLQHRRPGRFAIACAAMRARLAPGVVDPAGAIASIEQLAGGASSVGAMVEHPVDKRDAYVQWAIQAQGQLEGLLHRDDAEALFANPRHRDICTMPLGNQLTPLICAELRAKSRAFEETAAYLQRHLDRMQSSSGHPVVVDSNVLLQCLPLDEVDWLTVVKEKARVMVPLRVLEEIDTKKYGDNLRLRGVPGVCCRGLRVCCPVVRPDPRG